MAEVLACRSASDDCACVIAGFFHVDPDALFKSTRGAAHEAFPRQLMMAGLVAGLGYSSLTVGRAIGRDKATVEHACRLIEAIRFEAGSRDNFGVDDLIDIVGFDGVQDFLGGRDGAEEFLKHADRQIDEFFAAFRLVAVNGAAYRGELERRKLEMGAKP